jgi:hypothetical protein
MKLSSRMYRQIEIKIRRSIAADTPRSETTRLPDPNNQSIKQTSQEASGNR